MKNYLVKTTRMDGLNSGFINLGAKAFQHKLTCLKKAIIIDVRSPTEFAKGSIPNAINICYQDDDFWDRVESYKNGNCVFVYSNTSLKSRRACTLMRNGGFDKNQIFNLDGGYRSWKKGRV